MEPITEAVMLVQERSDKGPPCLLAVGKGGRRTELVVIENRCCLYLAPSIRESKAELANLAAWPNSQLKSNK